MNTAFMGKKWTLGDNHYSTLRFNSKTCTSTALYNKHKADRHVEDVPIHHKFVSKEVRQWQNRLATSTSKVHTSLLITKL